MKAEDVKVGVWVRWRYEPGGAPLRVVAQGSWRESETVLLGGVTGDTIALCPDDLEPWASEIGCGASAEESLIESLYAIGPRRVARSPVSGWRWVFGLEPCAPPDAKPASNPNLKAVFEGDALLAHLATTSWAAAPDLVTEGAWGEPVLEWWRGSRKLTIHIGPDEVTFVKVWGPDIEHEMEDGRLADTSPDALWKWLTE